MTEKGVYNPITGKYYKLRKRTLEDKNRISPELWKLPKNRKKSLWDIIFGV